MNHQSCCGSYFYSKENPLWVSNAKNDSIEISYISSCRIDLLNDPYTFLSLIGSRTHQFLLDVSLNKINTWAILSLPLHSKIYSNQKKSCIVYFLRETSFCGSVEILGGTLSTPCSSFTVSQSHLRFLLVI